MLAANNAAERTAAAAGRPGPVAPCHRRLSAGAGRRSAIRSRTGDLRTAAQCAVVSAPTEKSSSPTQWFSSWSAPEGKRLAAIVVDSSEEMRDREEENLRQLLHSNQIAAAAVSHEVRNLCGAISVVAANLRETYSTSDDMQALTSLARGLETVAAVELQTRVSETLEVVSLKSVLDDLRIVIEPQWREIRGAVRWLLPAPMPEVVAERHGLLQAFLNLAQNSHRAVQETDVRELSVALPMAGAAQSHAALRGFGARSSPRRSVCSLRFSLARTARAWAFTSRARWCEVVAATCGGSRARTVRASRSSCRWRRTAAMTEGDNPAVAGGRPRHVSRGAGAHAR